jgi:hypothetical protein
MQIWRSVEFWMSDYIQGEDDGCGGEFELEREFLFIIYALG